MSEATKQSFMPLAIGTMKDENSSSMLSLSGLTRQSTTSDKHLFYLEISRLQFSPPAAEWIPAFAGMTTIDWSVYFRGNLGHWWRLPFSIGDCHADFIRLWRISSCSQWRYDEQPLDNLFFKKLRNVRGTKTEDYTRRVRSGELRPLFSAVWDFPVLPWKDSQQLSQFPASACYLINSVTG